MIIALACDQGQVAERFTLARAFTIYKVDFGNIGSPTTVFPEREAPAMLLLGYGVDLVICGRIGRTSQQDLQEEGIKFFGGVSGRADQVLSAYLDGTLEPASDFVDYDEE